MRKVSDPASFSSHTTRHNPELPSSSSGCHGDRHRRPIAKPRRQQWASSPASPPRKTRRYYTLLKLRPRGLHIHFNPTQTSPRAIPSTSPRPKTWRNRSNRTRSTTSRRTLYSSPMEMSSHKMGHHQIYLMKALL